MKELLQSDFLKPPSMGKIIEGTVLGKGKKALFVDLSPIGTGIIYGQEFSIAKEKLKDLKPGDKILAKIIALENEEGYIELSVNEASKELTFEILKQKKERREVLKVKILGANKGGLLTEVLGISAFLPVSQLSPEHYPKVEDGEKTKILRELQKFIGKELEVQILDFAPANQQIILSEKAKRGKEIRPNFGDQRVGEIVKGKISGKTSFGVFVKFEDVEGLIPFSESIFPKSLKVGEEVQVKITEIKDNKVYLSLKI